MRRSDLTTEKRENVLMGPSEVSSVFPNEPFQLGVLGALAVSNFGLGLTHRRGIPHSAFRIPHSAFGIRP
jgi:hypothetical protein